ncbi:hypothetical protein DV515_00005625, partial [Chloebia gouldiae]
RQCSIKRFFKACDNICGVEPAAPGKAGPVSHPGMPGGDPWAGTRSSPRCLPHLTLLVTDGGIPAAGELPSHGPGCTDHSWEARLQPAHQPGRKARLQELVGRAVRAGGGSQLRHRTAGRHYGKGIKSEVSAQRGARGSSRIQWPYVLPAPTETCAASEIPDQHCTAPSAQLRSESRDRGTTESGRSHASLCRGLRGPGAAEPLLDPRSPRELPQPQHSQRTGARGLRGSGAAAPGDGGGTGVTPVGEGTAPSALSPALGEGESCGRGFQLVLRELG